MSKNNKFHALRTACEVEEQQVIEQKKIVDAVIDQRQKAFSEVQNRRDELELKLKKLLEIERPRAFQLQNGQHLAAITRYEQKLKREAAENSKLLKERREELERALERMKSIDEELLKAKVEKKKIDKLFDNWQQIELAKDAAIDEAMNEELAQFRRSK